MSGDRTPSADVIVAGAGHNSLITAAYLTRAGHRCLVLDARSVPGGGVASEELLLPGYRLDSCSTGHTLIQTNPVLADDELGLIAEHGLTYIEPDPVAHVVFPDGESLTMWLDLERTCAEIARFSRADERAYRRLLAEYDAVKDVFGRQRFTPVGLGPTLDQMLEGRAGASRWRRRARMSAWDVVTHEFESRHVRSFMLWMAFQTGQPVGSAGSAPLAYSIVFGRQRRSWTLPRGGSGELARALVEVIEHDGGEVLCDRRVVELALDGGRCVGVVTEDGERHLAREAVLSTIHVKDLVHMAPRDAWGEDAEASTTRSTPTMPASAPSRRTTPPPSRRATRRATAASWRWSRPAWRAGPRTSCAWGATSARAPGPRRGVAAVPHADRRRSHARAGRAPHREDPGHAALRPRSRRAGAVGQLRAEIAAEHLEHLRRAAPNLTDEKILAELIVSPVDLERSNPHMWHGTFHGGDRSLANSGALRPAPGWAQHRMPIPGLYQTGGTTHPGGSVTGGPGTQRGHRDALGLRTGPARGGRQPGAGRQPLIGNGCIIRPCALQ